MGDAEDDGARTAAHACEWVARWLAHARDPWTGPDEVVLYARRIVISFGEDPPVEVEVEPGKRFRLRVAPNDHPPAHLRAEADDGAENVCHVLYVPPSLGERLS